MKNILTIALWEIKTYFVSPLAYIVLACFTLLAGFFFFSLLQQFDVILVQTAMAKETSVSLNEWVITPFFQTLEMAFVFLIPLLTMNSIAGEKQGQTWELLLTSPLRVSEIVLAKFLAAASIVCLMILCAFVFPFILMLFADIEVPMTLVGLSGLFLFALSMTAIGIAVSACSNSTIIAGVVSLVFLLVFYLIDAPVSSLNSHIAEILKFIAPSNRAMKSLQGVITGVDLVYFISICSFGLFFASRVLELQRGE